MQQLYVVQQDNTRKSSTYSVFDECIALALMIMNLNSRALSNMSYLILPTVRWFHVASAHALDILLDRDCGAELVSPPRPVRRLQTHHIHRDVLLESGHAGVGNTLVTGTGAPVDQQVPGNDLKERFRLI